MKATDPALADDGKIIINREPSINIELGGCRPPNNNESIKEEGP